MTDGNMGIGNEEKLTKEETEKFLIDNIRLLHKMLQKYRGVHGCYDYDDLLQIASMGFCKGVATYDSTKGCKMTTYCYQLAQHEVVQYLRSQMAQSRSAPVMSLDLTLPGKDGRETLAVDNERIPEGGLNHHNPGPEEMYEQRETLALVKQVLATLSPSEQFIVQKCCIDGYTQEEVAAMLHISQANVSHGLNFARVKLKLAVKKENGQLGIA